MNRPIVEFDDEKQTITINGVKYNYGFFEVFANPHEDRMYSIKIDSDGVIVIKYYFTSL